MSRLPQMVFSCCRKA